MHLSTQLGFCLQATQTTYTGTERDSMNITWPIFPGFCRVDMISTMKPAIIERIGTKSGVCG